MSEGNFVSIEKFEQLDVWQAAHKLVVQVYKITESLPPSQRFGLVSQMQRSAVSVPANIAEGFKRRTLPGKCHFYNMAQGSLEELRYYFILCWDLGYKLEYDSVASQADQIGRMLTGLIRSVRE